MLPKNKIPAAALAIVWLSMMASSLTEGANATILLPSPTDWAPKATPSPTSQPLSCHVKTHVSNGQLNLRAGPGMQYAVLAILHEDEPIQVSTSSADWLFVETNHLSGWVKSCFVKCNHFLGGE
jgi:uncharacterized protein YgiM (DUF1202 family)